MQDPASAEGFERGGWTRPYGSDALLLGRVTYEDFAAAWPSMTDEAGFADKMNGMARYVDSRTARVLDTGVVPMGYRPESPRPGDSPMSYARVNDVEMYYEVHGTGQPLVVLHGASIALERVFEIAGEGSVGRPHVALALLEAGHVQSARS